MESKSDLCAHCGKHGYIKYYYLGLNDKVKNWFRNEIMCKKMLWHWEEKDHWLGRTTSWPTKKRILGWAKMDGAAMVLRFKPNMGFTNTLYKLQSYNFSRYSIWLC